MTLITKAILYVIFIAILVALITLLPTCEQIPLPALFASALLLVIGYVYAWASLFTVLNTLIWCVTFMIGLDLVIWIWNAARGIIGWVTRMIG